VNNVNYVRKHTCFCRIARRLVNKLVFRGDDIVYFEPCLVEQDTARLYACYVSCFPMPGNVEGREPRTNNWLPGCLPEDVGIDV